MTRSRISPADPPPLPSNAAFRTTTWSPPAPSNLPPPENALFHPTHTKLSAPPTPSPPLPYRRWCPLRRFHPQPAPEHAQTPVWPPAVPLPPSSSPPQRAQNRLFPAGNNFSSRPPRRPRAAFIPRVVSYPKPPRPIYPKNESENLCTVSCTGSTGLGTRPRATFLPRPPEPDSRPRCALQPLRSSVPPPF